jgi:hypothetical protein
MPGMAANKLPVKFIADLSSPLYSLNMAALRAISSRKRMHGELITLV